MGISIHFSGIEKRYPKRSLYGQFSGAIAAGACTCITGENGSGKSTFLKIIATLIRPSAGTITYMLNNQPLSSDEIHSQIAFISPEMQFYESLTAAENLAFFLGMTGSFLSAGQINNSLQIVNLPQASSMQLSNFSTGMKQRLKLALLYAANKKIWLLDEPSSNLDQNGRNLVKQLIGMAKIEQRTILLATNDSAEVAYADTLYRLT
ncbi:ABC transporter ATP-binding protein [Sporomusa acidovorans]|uniref:ABC transporter ATP-binding protein NatA n=1 Tax=Sporomusa acidovorans (strain ATCC 49682 / DSM 3132 / Mol) TaxID=1123286 RepID=A0ABZ3J0W2_SPOA4|nr:ABC transporter ATP-binding protein [Sporomusa acidovorans]OZC21392.1 energy-coupling factor transporter ATP-binding protein EcfA1 [Sporomusa acidovorans DSM 3132]SDE55482.1 heme exporter protein A [Sporomusa acidovorans]